ncbi:hypothetical protein Fmac_027147 [Flemingia macrophylla]|uniref:Uncharacterized protein n=1 Tax=Flemingia macrophylla TaxID=520843 RepID=A0ABD1LGV2_9FABA
MQWSLNKQQCLLLSKKTLSCAFLNVRSGICRKIFSRNSSDTSCISISPFTKNSSPLSDLPNTYHIRLDNTNNTVNKFKGESFVRGLGKEGVRVDELNGEEGDAILVLHGDLRVVQLEDSVIQESKFVRLDNGCGRDRAKVVLLGKGERLVVRKKNTSR